MSAATAIRRARRSALFALLLAIPAAAWAQAAPGKLSLEMYLDMESVSDPQISPDGARWTADPKVVTRADYRQDRVGFVDGGWSHVFVVPAEGDTLAGPHEPGDVVTLDLDRPDRVTQLTHVNDDVLVGITLGDVEEIGYESVDGYRIQGWIIKPPDFDPSKKYPLIMTIHGGPHSMYTTGFNFAWQDHAANGYVVLYTNPRGSTGYGSAFANATKNAYPGKDFDDLMNGVDEVVSRGYVDEGNMFLYGCSGGGVLTSWIVGHTDRFAAASANCPVIDWLSFVGTTDGIGWYHNFEKYPWEDAGEHLRRSPLMYVGNVTTPTMLMTGENDLRTPIPQTEEFYAALKVLGVPTTIVRFRNEWHGTTRTPSNFLRTQLYLRGWFGKYARRTSVTGP